LNEQAASPDIAVFLYEPGDGGLDRVAILLANGFAARGFVTELWLTRADGPSRFLISDTVRVRLVPAPELKARGLALALQIPALVKMIRTHRPKIILSAGNQSNLPIAIANRWVKTGITAAIQKITNPVARPGASGLLQRLRTWRFGKTAQLGDLTLVLGDADARNYAAQYPKAAAKFVMAHNPYVTPAMIAVGEERRATDSNRALKFINVARLSTQKDQATLLNALALIKDRNWQLLLVGDGPLRSALEDQANHLGITDRVTFVGFIADPLPYYAVADILVLSSAWEGLPAAPIEALAAGCGLVSTDCAPNLSALMHAASLPPPVPVGDVVALAKAITQAMDNPPNLDKARTVAARYSIEASVDDHLRHFAPWLS
jgi:glycosyltransferase involved in cell wall biosynthesis